MKKRTSIRKSTKSARTTDAEQPASGRLVIRMPISLHLQLRAEAREEGVSLNQLIIYKLAAQSDIFGTTEQRIRAKRSHPMFRAAQKAKAAAEGSVSSR